MTNFEMEMSVVVPAYNEEKRISLSLPLIYSSLTRRFSRFEIIVVDDGSTDHTYDILKSYKDESSGLIRLIRQENMGPSAARNKGLAIAKGTYIGFVDGDDFIAKNMYEKLHEEIQADNIDLVCCGRFDYYNNDKVLSRFPDTIASNHSLAQTPRVLNKTTLHICDKLFKKEIIQKYNLSFPEHIFFAEDCYFLTMYKFYCNKIYILSECLYYYNVESSNSITNVFNVRWNHIYQVLSEINEFFIKKGKFKKYKNALFFLSYGYFCRRIVDLCKFSNKKRQLEFVNGFCRYFNRYFPKWKTLHTQHRRAGVPKHIISKKFRMLYIYLPNIFKKIYIKIDKFIYFK